MPPGSGREEIGGWPGVVGRRSVRDHRRASPAGWVGWRRPGWESPGGANLRGAGRCCAPPGGTAARQLHGVAATAGRDPGGPDGTRGCRRDRPSALRVSRKRTIGWSSSATASRRRGSPGDRAWNRNQPSKRRLGALWGDGGHMATRLLRQTGEPFGAQTAQPRVEPLAASPAARGPGPRLEGPTPRHPADPRHQEKDPC